MKTETKQKAKQLLKRLQEVEETSSGIDSFARAVVKESIEPLTQSIKQNAVIRSLNEVNQKLASLKSGINMAPIEESIESFDAELQEIKEVFAEDIKSQSLETDKKFNVISSKIEAFDEMKNQLETAVGSLTQEFGTFVGENKNHVSSMNDLRYSFTKLQTALESLKGDYDTEMKNSSVNASQFNNEISRVTNDFTKSLSLLRTDMITRAHGGGNANRQINVNSSVMSLKYNDINLIGGMTAANNNTKKWVDITFSGGSSLVIDALAGTGVYDAIIQRNGEGVVEMTFEDGVTEFWDCQVTVPKGATSISSIKVLYQRKSTGNVYLQFFTAKSVASVTPGASVADQTDTPTTYTSSGSDGKVDFFTVPAGAYDGLGSVSEGDIVGIETSRIAGNAADTYNTSWRVIAVRFTFA